MVISLLTTFPRIQLGWEWMAYPRSEGHLVLSRAAGVVRSFRVCSDSLGSELGTVQLSWLCPGVTRGLPGNPAMSALVRRSWICCLSSRFGRSGQHQTLSLTTSMAWLPSSSTTVTAWPRRVMGCLEYMRRRAGSQVCGGGSVPPVDCPLQSYAVDVSLPYAVPVHPPNVQVVTPTSVRAQQHHQRPSDVCVAHETAEVPSAVSAQHGRSVAAVTSGAAMA